MASAISCAMPVPPLSRSTSRKEARVRRHPPQVASAKTTIRAIYHFDSAHLLIVEIQNAGPLFPARRRQGPVNLPIQNAFSSRLSAARRLTPIISSAPQAPRAMLPSGRRNQLCFNAEYTGTCLGPKWRLNLSTDGIIDPSKSKIRECAAANWIASHTKTVGADLTQFGIRASSEQERMALIENDKERRVRPPLCVYGSERSALPALSQGAVKALQRCRERANLVAEVLPLEGLGDAVDHFRQQVGPGRNLDMLPCELAAPLMALEELRKLRQGLKGPQAGTCTLGQACTLQNSRHVDW